MGSGFENQRILVSQQGATTWVASKVLAAQQATPP
jgi:hypothetical protein